MRSCQRTVKTLVTFSLSDLHAQYGNLAASIEFESAMVMVLWVVVGTTDGGHILCH